VKVLHVDTSIEWRGGQTQLLELVRRQPGEVHVAMRGDSPVVEAMQRTGAEVHLMPKSRRVRAAWSVRRIAQRTGVDLVAAHTSHAHAAAAFCGRPLVVHRRVDFSIRGPLSARKYAVPTGFVAVSEAVRQVLIGAGVREDRIEVVFDGVDATNALPHVGAGGIGALGALVEHKGHHVLIDAMTEITGRLRIGGAGPLWKPLQSAIDGLDLGSRVQLVGPVRSKWAFLADLDVLVHPSIEEGLGQVIIEAMAAGVPVVASRAGGICEVVEDGVTGRLVTPGSASELAGAIRAVFDEPELTARMVVAARAVAAQRFGVQRMMEQTMAAYERLLG